MLSVSLFREHVVSNIKMQPKPFNDKNNKRMGGFHDASLTSLDHSPSQNTDLDNMSESSKNNWLYSLPSEECFDLINYEPKPAINPLAQAVPSLTAKTKQVPKVASVRQKVKEYAFVKWRLSANGESSATLIRKSEKDLKSPKASSHNSFKKKNSNQVMRNKLSNYINTGEVGWSVNDL